MPIHIRAAAPEDAPALLAYMHDLLTEPTLDIPMTREEFTYTPEQEADIVRDFAESDNSIFLIAEVEGRVIGALSCRGGHRQANRHAVTLGITVHRDWRDQGLGTRMMQTLIEWARENPVVTRVELNVYAHNARAIHVYEKLGFAVEGRRRRSFLHNGEYVDDLIMALLV